MRSRHFFMYIAQHLRVGYTLLLLMAVSILFLLGIWDLFQFVSYGLSLAYVSEHFLELVSGNDIVAAIGLLALLVIIIPVTISVPRFLWGRRLNVARWIVHRSRWIALLIVLSSILVTTLFLFVRSMELTSGYAGEVPGSGGYGFSSDLDWAAGFLISFSMKVLPWYYLVVLSWIIWTVMDKKFGKWLAGYIQGMNLSDLNSDYHPTCGRHVLNFNSASMAPEIRFARKHLRSKWRSYQKAIPGSPAAADLLRNEWEVCQSAIRKLLRVDGDLGEREMRFFGGTSRALEVALSGIGFPRKIVLSPFEHPSEFRVSAWVSGGRDEVELLPFVSTDYERPWEEQRRKVLELIKGKIMSGGNNIILLSEVCYSTGLVIPVQEIINGVVEQNKNEKIYFIIDGAHAVGNTSEPGCPTITGYHSYIFSGNKWLFAPEPCAVSITKGARPAPEAYDFFGDDLPKTSSPAMPLLCLTAGLALMEEIGIETVQYRSTTLRDRFVEQSRDFLSLVGDDTDLKRTCLLAVKPKHLRWPMPDAIASYLWQQRITTLPIKCLSVSSGDAFGDEEVWIRLAFPYYLDLADISRLVGALRKLPN